MKWKKQNNNTPVLLTGAKGVGKTYLAYDFAKAFFDRIFYMNFEREPEMMKIFLPIKSESAAEKFKNFFQIDSGESKQNRILIIDEIGCCEEIRKNGLSEKILELFAYIIVISSCPLPAQFTRNMIITPLYPMEFDEFLRATGNEWYIDLIGLHFISNKKIPDIVHKELLELHQLYLQIGGMPGVVNEYINLSSVVNVSERHSFLIGTYHDYILKAYSDGEALKMKQVFDSLIGQLMKDNKKFQYNLIRKGTTHSMYKEAIQKLGEIHYIIKCNRITAEQLIKPDDYFEQKYDIEDEVNTNFKLYLPDTGLLYTKIKEEIGLQENNNYRKALLENYVAQSLHTKQYPFAFWESDSMAKIEFIVYRKNEILPIEIFQDNNTRSKSINILKQQCDFPYAIKISSRNFECTNRLKYVPYYAVFCI